LRSTPEPSNANDPTEKHLDPKTGAAPSPGGSTAEA